MRRGAQAYGAAWGFDPRIVAVWGAPGGPCPATFPVAAVSVHGQSSTSDDQAQSPSHARPISEEADGVGVGMS
jgi:hypothetical protein